MQCAIALLLISCGAAFGWFTGFHHRSIATNALRGILQMQSSYVSGVYIGDSISLEDNIKKEELLRLIDCLTSPSDRSDEDYDFVKDQKRKALLRENDYSVLRNECERRDLPTSYDKQALLINLLVNKLDPSMRVQDRVPKDAPQLHSVSDEMVASGRIKRNSPEEAARLRAKPRIAGNPDIHFIGRGENDPGAALKPLPVVQDSLVRKLFSYSVMRKYRSNSRSAQSDDIAVHNTLPAYCVQSQLSTSFSSMEMGSNNEVITVVFLDYDFRSRGARMFADELALVTQHKVILCDLHRTGRFDTDISEATCRRPLGKGGAVSDGMRQRLWDDMSAALTAIDREWSPRSIQVVATGTAGGALLDLMTRLQVEQQYAGVHAQLVSILGAYNTPNAHTFTQWETPGTTEAISTLLRDSGLFPFKEPASDLAKLLSRSKLSYTVDEDAHDHSTARLEQHMWADWQKKQQDHMFDMRNVSLTESQTAELQEAWKEVESSLAGNISSSSISSLTDPSDSSSENSFLAKYLRLLRGPQAPPIPAAVFNQTISNSNNVTVTRRSELWRLVQRVHRVMSLHPSSILKHTTSSDSMHMHVQKSNVVPLPRALVVLDPTHFDRVNVQETLTLPLFLTLGEKVTSTDSTDSTSQRDQRALDALSWELFLMRRRPELGDFTLLRALDADTQDLGHWVWTQSPSWSSVVEESRTEYTDRVRGATTVTPADESAEEVEENKQRRYMDSLRRLWVVRAALWCDAFSRATESRTATAGRFKERFQEAVSHWSRAQVENAEQQQPHMMQDRDLQEDEGGRMSGALPVGSHLHLSASELSALPQSMRLRDAWSSERERRQVIEKTACVVQDDDTEDPPQRPLWRR